MKLNPIKKTLQLNAAVIALTSIEVQILHLLLVSKTKKVKRETMINEIWTNNKNQMIHYNNHLDVALSRLKRKIFEETSKRFIFSDRKKSVYLKL